MSDEDPHNSNNRRDKKSKLFRPHEITDGKCSTKWDPKVSDWMVDYPISINSKFIFIDAFDVHARQIVFNRVDITRISLKFLLKFGERQGILMSFSLTSLESFDTNFYRRIKLPVHPTG